MGRRDAENAPRVFARCTVRAPLGDLSASDLERVGTGFKMGIPPRRIDILTQIRASRSRRRGRTESSRVRRRRSLPRDRARGHSHNKRAAGRPQDLADVACWSESTARASDEPGRSEATPPWHGPRLAAELGCMSLPSAALRRDLPKLVEPFDVALVDGPARLGIETRLIFGAGEDSERLVEPVQASSRAAQCPRSTRSPPPGDHRGRRY